MLAVLFLKMLKLNFFYRTYENSVAVQSCIKLGYKYILGTGLHDACSMILYKSLESIDYGAKAFYCL